MKISRRYRADSGPGAPEVGAPGPLGSPINVELEEVSNPMRRNFAILSFVLLSLTLATGFAAAQPASA
ncbi:MAG TPA: hypothetical protein VLR69_06710, partial [Thermoanaerobaculia bacterium]|nr:hypothetical protein [Thermoanaerobaculia bacterium]